MSVAYRDSSFDRPDAVQAAAAYAAGVRVWGGYLAGLVPPGPRSAGGSNLATGWSRADFEVLRAAGITPVAFASGWDDPAVCRLLASDWRVRLMLDVEDAIRGDGPWVDEWLAASGAGIYGLCSAHAHVAPAHIVARYPGIPVAASSWDSSCPRPAGLLGWQSMGTHTDPVTGLQADAGWVDEGFMDMTPEQDAILREVRAILATGSYPSVGLPAGDPDPWITSFLKSISWNQLGAIKAELDVVAADVAALQASGIPPAQLQPVLDSLSRLSAHLGVGTA